MLKGKLGIIGMGIGAISLMMALVHFWAGPFAPQPTLETAVAEAAAEIREATIRALQGEEPAPKERAAWDIDKKLQVATASFGGLAIIFAIFGYVGHEPKRQVAGAAALGVSAIVFQFFAWLALVLIFVILVAAVLQNFDFISF